MQFRIAARERDGAVGEIDADHSRTGAGEAYDVGAYPAAYLQDSPVTMAVEIHGSGEVAKLVEAVLVKRVEEGERPDRLVGDLEVVDSVVPVLANSSGQWLHARGGRAGLVPRIV